MKVLYLFYQFWNATNSSNPLVMQACGLM